jgi:hypothetical protein
VPLPNGQWPPAKLMISRIKDVVDKSTRDVLEHLDVLSARLVDQLAELGRRLESVQEALGRIERRQLDAEERNAVADHEFRVFSQWGEDGIIQFLLRHVAIEQTVFVEFGADFYNTESNTRFLLTNNNWSGLVIDGRQENIDRIFVTRAYWMHQVKAARAFVTKDNINRLLRENGVSGEIGLLSIDIDGNDYWVWKAIDVISPVIVIVEYNYRFGSELAVTIPYDESFDREKAHPSRVYYGASLKALCELGRQKGYAFVGCNSNGINAFFVRRDRLPKRIKELTPETGFVAAKVAEVFQEGGRIVRKTPEEETVLLRNIDLPLVNVMDDLTR